MEGSIMNISITNDCNRRCQYCFQRSWYLPQKVGQSVKEMSVEDFEQLLIWFVKSIPVQHDSLKLLGGEPLLHSRIYDIINTLEQWRVPYSIISNISVDSSIITKLLPIAHHLSGWLVNSDYPSNQKEVFITNFKVLCSTTNSISVSTTVLPDPTEIQNAAFRIKELVEIYKSIRGNTESLNIRLSPNSPNPSNGQFVSYDFSADLANFFNIAWSAGQTQANFDCKINYCELTENAINEFRKAGIVIPTGQCTPNSGCPFDILVDGSIIWCSSANFIKLESWKDYADYDEAMKAITDLWTEKWKTSPMRCNWQSCGKFNPALCHGLCIAKNEFIK